MEKRGTALLYFHTSEPILSQYNTWNSELYSKNVNLDSE